MKKEIGKSVEDFVDRTTIHVVANVGSSQASLDSGNCSSKSLELTTQPTVFPETQMDRFNNEVIFVFYG